MKDNTETRTLLRVTSLGYLMNLVCGIGGIFFRPGSVAQMTAWQFADSAAIMASILASRYIGTRNEHLAASGFTLLAIAYGISFSSSSFTALNEEKMATIILPLVPAMLLVGACKLFPLWSKIACVLICIPFFIVYITVLGNTYSPNDWSNFIAYPGIQVLGVIWSIYLWKDF